MATARYNTYVGMRYVPIFDGEWDRTKTYEPLTIVSYQGNSYTSRTFIPTGMDINNTDYWALTGNYNAQVEYYRQETQRVAEALEECNFAYNNVAEMIADESLSEGKVCNTLGYYSVGDGGGATYIIGSTGTANGLDIIECDNELIATLVKPVYGNPLMYGAYGDDTHDDYDAIVRCIEQHDYTIFPSDKTYLIGTTLNIGEGKTIEGYSATIHGTANPAVLVKNYESSQVHTALPIYIKGLAFKGNNTNTLVSLQNALKVSVIDTRYYDFSVGLEQTSGYELYVQNFRAVGGNATAIGMLMSSGDCSVSNVVMRDVHTAIKLLQGPGRYTFNYVHCWILNPNYFENSCMFDTAIYGGRDCICDNFYFDTYHKPIIKRGLCYDIFKNPVNTYLASVATAAGVQSGTFITFVDNPDLFNKNLYGGKIEIDKYIEKIQTTPFYSLTNDTTIPFKFTFGTAFATTVDAFNAEMAQNLFTLASGVELLYTTVKLTPDAIVINGRIVLPANHAPTASNPTIKLNEKIYFEGITTFCFSRPMNDYATLYARLNYINLTANNPATSNTYILSVTLPYNFVN